MLETGGRILGYVVRQVTSLPEINAVFHHLEHIRTGARHVHIQRNDPENTFGVAFKTVPADSTGVAHILEHTVLCGSRKFPVRDPFFAMLKRSLSTFMNAFTSSDWTMYPFSTQNRKDYFNLMDVYLDAAFFPRIEELSFKQEGHRLEIHPDSATGQSLVYKGIVYNEMKGAMSSPDQVMARSMLNALYPSTTYRFNSGGDPAEIPSLTHTQLKEFHQRHYHPSNAYFYTYGCFDLRDQLAFIEDKILKGFDRIDPQTDVPSQPRWKEPLEKTYAYALSEGEDPKQKSQVCLAWLTADIRDSFEVLTLKLLEQILLGNSASPLRKALIDSQLGTALSDGTGFDAENRDTLFACGLKGVSEDSASRIKDIILSALENLVSEGIDPLTIESAIHQIEFHRKEVTNTPYPYGLRLLLTFAAAWFHDGQPERVLQLDSDLLRIREALTKERFFENRIARYFLDNPHRVLLTLRPDIHKAKDDEKKELERLRILADGISPEELQKLSLDAENLRRIQESEENISCLPTLEITDIPPEIPFVSFRDKTEDPPILCYDQPTSGISYFSATAGLGELPARLLPLVPFFCSSLPRMGTTLRDYTEIVRQIDLYTGGVGLSAQARIRYDLEGECLPFVVFNGKSLGRNISKMYSILQELMAQFSFSDLPRLKNLLLEYQAGLESAVVQNGHRHCMLLASRNFSVAASLNETWFGVHQLKTIQALTSGLSGKTGTTVLENLSADLNQIGALLFRRSNLKIALVGEGQALTEPVDLSRSLVADLPSSGGSGYCEPPLTLPDTLPREGWTTATAVSFIARSLPTVRMDHEDAPSLAVISKMMRSMYLHREIREKGGAYGGYAMYSPETGLFHFASYRDPHILETLQAFNGAGGFICSGHFQAEDVKEAVLQVCSEIDKPDTPATAAKKAFQRWIVGLEDESRLRFKKRLLSLTKDRIVATGRRYFSAPMDHTALTVISSEEKLKAANEKLGSRSLRIEKI
ncbi:MAG: insulinase family protein [Thermodesulfobacteriota bacterium]